MEAYGIIYDWFAEMGELSSAMESLMKWLPTDDLVGWFFHSYFANDVRELREALGEERADVIEEYYDLHCR